MNEQMVGLGGESRRKNEREDEVRNAGQRPGDNGGGGGGKKTGGELARKGEEKTLSRKLKEREKMGQKEK